MLAHNEITHSVNFTRLFPWFNDKNESAILLANGLLSQTEEDKFFS